MMNRTKIAIIGDDISAFHLFNTMYRSDDRFEVICFFRIHISNNLDDEKPIHLYPRTLTGSLYPNGIPINTVSPFQTQLQTLSIEKCIFSPLCVTSSQYLYLTAQCMAAECSVISHSLEMTRLQPPKAFVSFFSDTQFDIQILIRILKTYRDSRNRPAVVLPGPFQKFVHFQKRDIQPADFFTINSQVELNENASLFDSHKLELCKQLLLNKYLIFFVYDFDAFSSEALRNDSFDMIVFVGFNSLPCFFESHLVVYACDDFTFGENISEHPSSILCRQSDLILYAHLGPENSKAEISKFTETKIVPLPVSFASRNQSCYPNEVALLVDDRYPTRTCNAARSISEYLAKFCNMKILPLRSSGERPEVVADSPIYSEPSEKEWPALIIPDKEADITTFNERSLPLIEGYKIIVSATSKPCRLKPRDEKQQVIQFTFDLDFTAVTPDILSLPAGAFVKQRKR